MVTKLISVRILNLKKNNIFLYLIKYLSFLLGVFISMPIITLKLHGILFSVFTIIYAIVLFILPFTLKTYKITLGKFSTKVLIWFILTIISSIYGILFFINNYEWYKGIIVYIPKILSFIYLLVFLYNSKYKLVIINNFFSGFILGCMINIIWACVEGLFFYYKGYSLNNIIFSDFIQTLPSNRKYISIVNEGGIRVPGLNYDPAHLGTIIPIIFIYSLIKKRYIILLLSLLSLIFSQSTTAMLCVFVLFFININKLNFNLKSTYFKMLFGFVVISILFIILYNFFDTSIVLKSIKQNSLGFTDRIFKVYIRKKELDPRSFYHLYLPSAIIFNGANTIIGTGFKTASYPYVFNKVLMDKKIILQKFPYDLESVYISYLFDTGILGLFLYVYILLKIYVYSGRYLNHNCNITIYATFGGIIFSGFFYHYTLAAFHIVSIIMTAVLIDLKIYKVR